MDRKRLKTLISFYDLLRFQRLGAFSGSLGQQYIYIYIYIYMVDSHKFCPLVVLLFLKNQLFYRGFKPFPI